ENHIHFLKMCEHNCNTDDIADMNTAEQILMNETFSIEKKMRALFYLRNIITDESADIISKALFKNSSILLLHEICYVLGQMRLEKSINFLISILNNENFDIITRHEAAEALGNYRKPELIKELIKFINYKEIPLRETCYIAIKKIKMTEKLVKEIELSQFNSRDPAIPLFKEFSEKNMNESIDILKNSECLYEKYRAMFFLRDFDEFLYNQGDLSNQGDSIKCDS
ncbi:putative protein carboxyl methylase, partial [Pseudoloma neurophilia]